MPTSIGDLRNSLRDLGKTIKHSVADVLQSTDFISRTIGMENSYEDLTYIIQALGREPVSLLGKDFAFIYDHVRRNYEEGTTVRARRYGVDTSSTGDDYSCAKFTFYKERPTIRFADPYTDPMNLLDRWMPDYKFNGTKAKSNGFYYAESRDDATNNIDIVDFEANAGTESGVRVNSIKSDETCDLIRKTNDYFKHGKYRTLVARFHTDSQDSKDFTNSTQTAISSQYGMSHGRNLLSGSDPNINGYDNPYCRVWTYHHQYKSMMEAIRPFQGGLDSAEGIRSEMGDTSFRTLGTDDFGGGSERLDKYGVLNYENGFVNIAPKAKIINYFHDKEDDKDEKSVSIKRCMFSIENLAWKGGHNNKGRGVNEFDPDGLSAEQKGPLGGRIMWFPPYDIKFSETSHAKWNSNEFIGRGESIYTYVNSERIGDLSFKLLIDHPSIIDYWEDRDKDSSYGGVDDINSNESKLLRFFAGCDILKAKPQTYWYKEPIVKPNEEGEESPKKVEEPQKSEPPTETTGTTKKTLYCFVFYPNNYSGVDDDADFAIHYLLNGIGTQKRINIITKEAEDFGVDMSSNYTTDGYGGYEMRGHGISIVTKPLKTDNYCTIRKTFADLESKDRKGQYLTNENGEAKSADYGTPTFLCLAKQVGNKADSLASAKKNKDCECTNDNPTCECSSLVTKSPHTWFRKRWYYRVDKSTENQDLLDYTHYIDTNSSKLNSKDGLGTVKSLAEKQFGLKFTENDSIVSLTDMYMALEKGAQDVFNGLYDDANVKLVSDIFDKEKYKVTGIKTYGHASSHNNTSDKEREKRNTSLARNRANTFEKWLTKENFPGIDKAKYEEVPGVQKGEKNGDVNAIEPKFWRSAHIVVEYEEVKEAAAQETQSETQEVTVDAGTDKERKVDAKKVETLAFPTTRVETQPTPTFNGVTRGTSINDLRDKGVAPQFVFNEAIMNYAAQDVGHQTPPLPLDADYLRNAAKNVNFAESVINKSNTEDLAILAAKIDKVNKENEKKEEKNNIIGYETKTGPVERYDNEGEYFKMLDKKDPFLHRLISEKIKYFDPAFHSISPEGFNARLTFLHQCTRQGATVGNSDNNSLTAYNLAFGRPPVCVLRIGDFYYTKIIIESVNIDYDDMQWDLNPEGIGVMPMMANIKISFKFIGGSDLAGPISRLQNAVSFNYYANTGVYDNRAEMVEYAPDKSGKEVKFKGYVFPSISSEDDKEQ